MKDRKLAARYARALLSVLPDPKQAEAAEGFLISLARLLDGSKDFRDVMLDPAFSGSDRESLLRSLAERGSLPPQVGNFLSTLVHHNRVTSLPSIAELFRELREEALGITPAEITTAAPMSEPMVARARAALEKLTGRKVRLVCRVQADLIGGAVTRIGSKVYDGSLRTQLGQLRRRMTQE